MASYIDFQELKARVTIQQVLDMLGVKNLKPHGETLRGHCPCCKEGNDRVFVVTPAKNIYYCFAEKKGGDIIELSSRFWRVTQREAAGRIAKHFGAPEPGGDRPTDWAKSPWYHDCLAPILATRRMRSVMASRPSPGSFLSRTVWFGVRF